MSHKMNYTASALQDCQSDISIKRNIRRGALANILILQPFLYRLRSNAYFLAFDLDFFFIIVYNVICMIISSRSLNVDTIISASILSADLY